MENLKIKNANTNEILKNLAELGYVWTPMTHDSDDCLLKSIWVITESNGDIFYSSKDEFINDENHKEITIQELKDMVVLDRNDQKDRTHVDSNNYDWYVASDEKHYRYQGSIWVYQPHVDCLDLEPIKKEKPMKEYLDPDNEYALILADDDTKSDQWIEIPSGADIAFKNQYGEGVSFFKNEDNFGHDWYSDSKKWVKREHKLGEWYFKNIVWNRQKEVVDLMQDNDVGVSDSVSSINETLAERESQYGSFSDVAELTCDLMGDLIRPDMSFVQREALHMICSKLARIRCGDIDKIDSWHDIAGYATLVVQDLEKKSIDSANINKTDNRDWVEEIESSKD